ncbi:MAG TPA: hypothetical protein VD772_04745, partial [Anseongella sp.]|nr:hypothetical protein [Anseongella sp.]
MNKNLLYLPVLTIAVFAACAPASSQTRIDFEEYEPVSTLVVPEHRIGRAKFPFVDVHSHQRNMTPDRLSELGEEMDVLNMKVMVNLSGGSGNALREMTENIRQHSPGRFLVFANIDFAGIGEAGWTEKAVKQLEEDVRQGAAGLKIFKNLGFSVTDNTGKRVAVDDP